MQKSPAEVRRTLFWMVVGGLAVRLAVMVFLYPQHLDPENDHWSFGFEEGRVARSIAEGKGFGNPLYADTGPTAWFAPAFPYLLAGVFNLFGIYGKASALVILSFDCLVSSLTCLPIFFFGRKSFGHRTGVWAGWTWAFFPYAVYYPVGRIWDTWLTTFLLSVLFLIILHLEHSARLWHWVGFGLLSGLAALSSPVVLSVLPVLALWMCYRLHRQGKKWLAPAAGAVLAVIAAVAPWFVRNYRTFHAIIPVRDSLGFELYVGNNGDTSHPYSRKVGPWNNEAEWREYVQMGEYAYLSRKGQDALAYVSRHRVWYVLLTLRRVLYVWTNFWSFDRHYLSENPFDPLIVLLYTTLTMLTLLGLWRAFREEISVAMPYAIVLLFFPLVYYITHSADWYRRPIDPFFIVLAVYAVTRRPSRKEKPLIEDAESSRQLAQSSAMDASPYGSSPEETD